MIIGAKKCRLSRLTKNPHLRQARLTIIDMMQPMLAQAKREGLVLWNRYRDQSFTPQELEAQWAQGCFIWGPDNWELRRPRSQQ